MNIELKSLDAYKGFRLPAPLELDAFLNVITGKNGSGKTRLLESIKQGHTKTSIDGQELSPTQASLIDINNPTNSLLSPYHNIELAKILSEEVFKLIVNFKESDKLPDSHPLYVSPTRMGGTSKEFNIKKIVQNAESLFNKKMELLQNIELEFSVLINKDIINCSIKSTQASLSQLTVNYFQTLEKYEYLKFKESNDKSLSLPNTKVLNDFFSQKSPPSIFNEIIQKLFRGKYSIAPPDIKRAHLEYNPYLTLACSNEKINQENLSSGEKSIFWLAEKTFYTINSHKNSIFNGVSVILIDEPDCHLHPQMVQDFYDCLIKLHDALNVVFIFTTHSPTTIALFPNDNIINICFDDLQNQFTITKLNKDGAISQLLEGISQISVNPENGRQVYVENLNDSQIYEKFYTAIKNKSSLVDPNINLTFISAGPKIAENELMKHIESVFGKSDNSELLISKINGDANCQQVIGVVEHLSSKGNRTVRGLIDWDKTTRQHNDKVIVFARERAYSIENIIYDPLSIYAYLTANAHYQAGHFIDTDEDYFWRHALYEHDKSQLIIDRITENILNRPNKKDYNIEYMGGLSYKGDSEYFIPQEGNGHKFEQRVLQVYPEIFKLNSKTSGKPLIYHFGNIATLNHLGWEFVNKEFENAFVNLQK